MCAAAQLHVRVGLVVIVNLYFVCWCLFVYITFLMFILTTNPGRTRIYTHVRA